MWVGEVEEHLGLGQLRVVGGEVLAGLDNSGGDSGGLAAVHELVTVLAAGPDCDTGVDFRPMGAAAFGIGQRVVI